MDRYLVKYLLTAVAVCCLITGCDPVTRHKALSTIFNGVPSLPPADEYCSTYYKQKETPTATAIAPASGGEGQDNNLSRHAPYEEKKCDDCHDKTKEGGLVRPKQELCFICHENFGSAPFVHGPVAVGDCLACHLPHRASFAPLLKADKKDICATCHSEKRLAAGMHDAAAAKQMVCVDCHNPHSGNIQYFLK